jgi:hypothetical protein
VSAKDLAAPLLGRPHTPAVLLPDLMPAPFTSPSPFYERIH